MFDVCNYHSTTLPPFIRCKLRNIYLVTETVVTESSGWGSALTRRQAGYYSDLVFSL